MTARTAPGIVVETGGLLPPLSGVGHYSRELLRAYAALPGHLPLTLTAPRFFLRRGQAPGEGYLAGLAADLEARVEVQRRLVPAAVYAGLRCLGRRPPVPLDLWPGPGGPRVYFFPNYVGEPLLRRRCVPVIYDFSYLLHPRSLRGRDDLFLRHYVPATLRRALRVVVISDSVGRELQRAYAVPAERITTVPPAVDHARFRPDLPADARRRVRDRYGLAGPYIFSLGTLEPRKNFPRLIRAFAVLASGPFRGLTLALGGGPGWKNRDIPETITRLGLGARVKLLGYVRDEDRGPLLAEADVFALPALYEGFGLPVLEAMACGTPVVTSARGALPEVARDAAVYVDPLDPEDIARGLSAALGSSRDRERLRAAGIRRAADFGWDRSARLLARVFEQALGEAGLGPGP
jgi:glycosyltransferase involved in cell wall biosynthesis